MGTYTEIVFGARLAPSTPKNVIDTLRYAAGENMYSDKNLNSDDPVVVVDNDLLNEYDISSIVRAGGSYYYGVLYSTPTMFYNDITRSWILSFRGNCKNYNRRIEKFLEWISQYVIQGSGEGEIYATVYHEEGVPEVYSLRGTYTVTYAYHQ